MGSFIELNDTLRISKEQGFPEELDVSKHLSDPIDFSTLEGKVFSFHSKKSIRVYKAPPVRNFLVEDIDGKWLYWGLCFITEITHDYVNQVTSGKYKIVRLNTPEEMKEMYKLIHFGKPEEDYFIEQ